MTRFSQGLPLQPAIKAVAWYKCSANTSASSGTSSGSTASTPSTPAPSTPLPSAVQTDLYVQVAATATAGLRLHIQPSSDSTANVAEMPGTQLHVIEDKTGALAKIGETDQWLYVVDPSGNQGYVAAWYVQQVQSPAPYVNARTGSRIHAFNAITIYYTVNAVCFTAAPSISTATLDAQSERCCGPGRIAFASISFRGRIVGRHRTSRNAVNSDRTIRYGSRKSRSGKSMDQRARPKRLARLCHGFFCCSCVMTRSVFEK